MAEHSGLSIKIEETNGRCFWIGAVSVDLPPTQTEEQTRRELIVEMESGERRHIDKGTAYIMNSNGKTIGRVFLDMWAGNGVLAEGQVVAPRE